MTKLRILLASIILIGLFGCQTELSTTALLTGTIENPATDSITVYYYQNEYLEGKLSKSTQVNDDGTFSIELPVSTFREFNISLTDDVWEEFIAKAGWEVVYNVAFDEQGNLDTLNIGGDHSSEILLYKEIDKISYSLYQYMDIESPELVWKLDSMKIVMEDKLNIAQEQGLVDSALAQIIHANIEYGIIGKWSAYAMRKFKYMGMEPTEFEQSKIDYYNSLVEFNRPEFIHSTAYKYILYDQIEEQARLATNSDSLREIYQDDPEQWTKVYYDSYVTNLFDVTDKLVTNPELKLNCYYYFVLRNLDLQNLELLKELNSNRLNQIIHDEYRQNIINEKIAKYERLLPGNPAPLFSGKDTSGVIINLSDFLGTYVYVDIWATWCGPCRGEIPKLKELEHEFGDEITIISISVDGSEEDWKNFVRDEELRGVQILSEGGWGAGIAKEYMVSGIPTFLMIDPEGNIIDAQAPRPSNKQTREIIEEWLEQ